MIRAALLDEHGVYVRMDELADPGQLTARHLPQITACDLPPGRYKWVRDAANRYDGAFWALAWLKRIEQDKVDVQAAQEKAQRIAARRAQRRLERGEG